VAELKLVLFHAVLYVCVPLRKILVWGIGNVFSDRIAPNLNDVEL
jgi:hypothetical protein